jgi:hypothetical protein
MDLSGLSSAQRPAAKAVVAKCIQSREYFIKEILKAELQPWQLEVVRELDSGGTKLSIRSGHGVGKTALVAMLALHFLLFRDDVKIIVTSPSADQMKDGLIPEINKWISRLPSWMSASLSGTSERVVRYPDDKNNFISFRTARKENPEALAGVHATHVMILVDEASGVDEVVYETGQGALSTEGSIAILIGNPTRPSGFFYKTQTILKDLWWTRKVSCRDSTMVSDDYILSQLRTYGADSREFRVRVLGEFPESGQDSVIPRAFVTAALERDVSAVTGDIVWGVDPGRGGDPTGFCERSSNVLTELKLLRYSDVMNVVGWLKQRYDHTPIRLRPVAIYVDSIGLGAGVADRLLELELPVVHVNVAETSSMSDRFVNLRAELGYALREWLESREVAIAPTEMADAFTEQCSEVQQKFTSTGKVQLESKMEMKKRGVASPNLYDAAALTFADGANVRIGSYEHSWGKINMANYKVPNVSVRRK